MKLKALAIAASIAVSGAAQAGWEDGSSTAGNGELLFMAWDTTAQKAVVVDTGIDFLDIYNAGGSEITAAVDMSVFGGNTSGISWSVIAGNASTSDIAEFGVLASSLTTGDILTFGGISNVHNRLQAFNGANIVDASPKNVDNAYVANSSSDAVWPADLGLNAEATIPFNMTGGENDVMNLLQVGLASPSQGQTLSIATVEIDNGTLYINRAATNPVPVPAAAWLMASALAGFGAVARRKKQA